MKIVYSANTESNCKDLGMMDWCLFSVIIIAVVIIMLLLLLLF